MTNRKYIIIILVYLLASILLTASACTTIEQAVKSVASKIPSQTNNYPKGTYTATIMGSTRTMTFSGDGVKDINSTVTSYDSWSGEHIVKYRYYITKVVNGLIGYGQDIGGKPITAQDADTIWMQDVATGEQSYVKFRYIPEQDIVVLDLSLGVGNQTMSVSFYKK